VVVVVVAGGLVVLGAALSWIEFTSTIRMSEIIIPTRKVILIVSKIKSLNYYKVSEYQPLNSY